jgi:CDP-diacylglycerol pyrophosphatase
LAYGRSRLVYYGTALLALAAAGTLVGTKMLHGTSRDRLRLIVQQQCVADWLEHRNPAPCLSVTLPGNDPGGPGYAVLQDRKGGAHFLLIPTRPVRGIESPEVRAPGALNYFEAAWGARAALAEEVGHPVPAQAVAMAVNQRRARSQDQLHIHISCLRPSVHAALQASATRIGPAWAPLEIGGRRYQAMRVTGTDLAAANPFALLAEHLPGAADAMGDFTLLVAGMRFREGPGFALLAGRAVPGAELLLDSSCAVAR